jgi:hypothetical protein
VFVAVWSDLIEARGGSQWGVQKASDGVIPTAADHFHHSGWNAMERQPLIGTDYPPLVSNPCERISTG